MYANVMSLGVNIASMFKPYSDRRILFVLLNSQLSGFVNRRVNVRIAGL